jgi:hypothetical protein
MHHLHPLEIHYNSKKIRENLVTISLQWGGRSNPDSKHKLWMFLNELTYSLFDTNTNISDWESLRKQLIPSLITEIAYM